MPESKALRFVRYEDRGAVYPALGCSFLTACLDPQLDTPSTVLKNHYYIHDYLGDLEHRFFSGNIFLEDDPGFIISEIVDLDEYSPPACGEDVNITSITSLEISGYGGSIFLDSVDSANGMHYDLEWITCEL